jgi:RsmE family RNA methyltransferase
MRLIFFERDKNGKPIIPETEIHHLKVLRRSFPFKIRGICSQQLFTVELASDKTGIFVAGLEKIADVPKRKTPFFLVPLIEWSRLEWCLEKLCELEAADIYLYLSDHSASSGLMSGYTKKSARLQKIILEACRQSGNTRPPQLHPPQKLPEFLQKLPEPLLILACKAEQELQINDFAYHGGVLVGPEGDFSAREYKQLEKHGKVCHLGKVILRSETAVIYAAAMFKGLNAPEAPAEGPF